MSATQGTADTTAVTHDLPRLIVDGIGKTYVGRRGQETKAIGEVGFTQEAGEILAIVGPSGCGKTTLLRCLAGLLAPSRGRILIDGEPVRGVTPGLSVVFQEYNRSLFPWLTLLENVRFPIVDRGKAASTSAAERALQQVGLGDVGGHHPWQVSGGMQQRAAIARAIVTQPRVLLMDEPFASVDAQTRITLEQLTMNISREIGLTTVLITHDIDEAILMSNRVVVLSKRPSHVLKELPIELPWPRDDIETKAHPRFLDLRREVHDLIVTR